MNTTFRMTREESIKWYKQHLKYLWEKWELIKQLPNNNKKAELSKELLEYVEKVEATLINLMKEIN